jgi:hypothetical protein
MAEPASVRMAKATPDSKSLSPHPQSILDLPPELHLAISRCLNYPDALSLKHTSSHFYQLVDTGIWLKVAWLLERKAQNLPFPTNGQCCLQSDKQFCTQPVRRTMEKWRRHRECGERKGCVVGGVVCRRRPERSWSQTVEWAACVVGAFAIAAAWISRSLGFW